MKRILATLAATLCLMATSAFATTFTPTASDIFNNFGFIGGTHIAMAGNTGWVYEDQEVGFTSVFKTQLVGGVVTPWPSEARFGESFSSGLDLSSFDTYRLAVFNNNENPWNFRLYLKDGANTAYSSDYRIVNGNSAELIMGLSGLAGISLNSIDEIGVQVYETTPIAGVDGLDNVAEFGVAPVPEPGTMMLLGAGFLGLAIYAKRRKNA